MGKEAGFSFPGREGAIVNNLLSLSKQGGDFSRKWKGDRSKFVYEDN